MALEGSHSHNHRFQVEVSVGEVVRVLVDVSDGERAKGTARVKIEGVEEGKGLLIDEDGFQSVA